MANRNWSNGKWVIIIAVIIAVSGCRPKGILSSRKMRNVLYDLHRAEAILQVEGLYYGHDEELARYYEVVLDKNNVTKAEFDSSLVWYTDHPQLFNKIYPKVMKRCEAETKMWQEKFEQLTASGAPVRDLPSIEEVKHRMQYGLDTQLSLGELPPQELLLPVLHPDSVVQTESVESPAATDNSGTSDMQDSLVVSAGQEAFPNDSLTPEERERKTRFDNVFRRFRTVQPSNSAVPEQQQTRK